MRTIICVELTEQDHLEGKIVFFSFIDVLSASLYYIEMFRVTGCK